MQTESLAFERVEPDSEYDELCFRHKDGWPEVWVHRVTFGRHRLRIGWSRETLPDWHEKWRERGVPWGYYLGRDYCFAHDTGALTVALAAVLIILTEGGRIEDLPEQRTRPWSITSPEVHTLSKMARADS